MKEKYGMTALYEKWADMLAEVKPDAVDVCTPNGVHAPAVIDAANAGCHVLTEKPMAMTPAECEAMIAAAKANDVKLVTGFQFRYHPNSQMLCRARDAGEFGDIMFVKCQALRRRGIPNWGVFGQKDLQGGGPMIDIGVHVIEMAHYVIGSPKPVAASGNTWTYIGDKPSKTVSTWPNWDYKTYTVEDLAIGQIRFENGALLQIEASFCAHIEKDVWNFSLMGTKGGASWDGPAIYKDRYDTMVNERPAYLPNADFGKLFVFKLQNWVDGILKGTKLEAPRRGRSGRPEDPRRRVPLRGSRQGSDHRLESFASSSRRAGAERAPARLSLCRPEGRGGGRERDGLSVMRHIPFLPSSWVRQQASLA